MDSSTTQIAKVLSDSDSNTADPATTEMFLRALPHTFGGERHDFQVRLANMLREILKQAREKQKGKQASAATSLEETNATLEKLQQEKNDAAAKAACAKAMREEKRTMLSGKKESTATAAQRHEETVRTNARVAEHHAEIEQSKTEIDTIVTCYLSMLVSGNWDTEEARDDFVKPVMDYLEQTGCDKVLFAALPKALGCHPDKRGDFTKVAVGEVVKSLHDRASTLASSLEESKVRFEEAKAENLGAWAIADVARDAEKLAEEEKNIAEEHLHQATIIGKLAVSSVDDLQMKLEGIKAVQAYIETKLADIDAAVKEMDHLETDIVDIERESADVASPAAKRLKLSECTASSPAHVMGGQ